MPTPLRWLYLASCMVSAGALSVLFARECPGLVLPVILLGGGVGYLTWRCSLFHLVCIAFGWLMALPSSWLALHLLIETSKDAAARGPMAGLGDVLAMILIGLLSLIGLPPLITGCLGCLGDQASCEEPADCGERGSTYWPKADEEVIDSR